MFAVVRHPDIEAPGFIPEGALELHRAKGWIRISEWREAPSDFHLSDFAESFEDLDAPEEKKPAKGRSPAKSANEKGSDS
jgi:hypothetical protein